MPRIRRHQMTRRGARTGGLLALGAACLLAGAPAATARHLTHRVPQHLTYKLLYTVHGEYMSSYRTGELSDAETTDFLIFTHYKNLEIPLRGPASSTINVKTGWIDILGSDWEAFGNGLGTDGNVVPYDCKTDVLNADTEQDGPAHIFSGPGSARTALNLDIQAAPQVRVVAPTGSDPAAQGGCSFFEGQAAFSPLAFRLMPDMLTARVSIPLAKLRALRHRGDVWGMSFTDSHALAHPPADCGGLDGSCNMHWKAELKIARTS